MTTVEFSPDGQILASAGGDSLINLWDRESLLQATSGGPAVAPTQLAGHTNRIYHLRFSPDGSRLAAADIDYMLRVWTVAEPDAAPLVLAHPYQINGMEFDPEGRRLITAGSDAHTYLWDLENPGEPVVFSGAAAEVRDVEFSPDGQLIAAVSLDGSLRLWPTQGGDPIVLDAGFELNMVAFADAGRRVAVAGFGTQLPLWSLGDSLDPSHLQTRVMQATQVCLRPEQRMRFVGESLEVATKANAACSVSWLNDL